LEWRSPAKSYVFFLCLFVPTNCLQHQYVI
jgi:hypothetical protein